MGLFSRLFSSSAPVASRPAPKPPRAPARPEPAITAFFTEDHRACDARWGAVEAAEGADTWRAFAEFDASMRRHLRWEEEVLFPAFEDATGHHGFGPTVIMRGEHDQMRAMLDTMARCVAAEERTALLDHGDTLLMLVQQHNAKEEGMLYPMSDEALAPHWATIKTKLDAIG